MKAAIAMFCGTAALATAVGFGGLDVSPAGGASTTTHPSSPAFGNASVPGGDGVIHHAILTSCISHLDC